MDKGLQAWVTSWGAAVQLLGSLLLLGVTAWYAWLTKRLTESAMQSAQSAERTASLAREALELQASQAELALHLGIMEATVTAESSDGRSATKSYLAGLGLSSVSGAAYVQGFTVDAVTYFEKDRKPTPRDFHNLNRAVLPDPSEPYPRRIGPGNPLAFTVGWFDVPMPTSVYGTVMTSWSPHGPAIKTAVIWVKGGYEGYGTSFSLPMDPPPPWLPPETYRL